MIFNSIAPTTNNRIFIGKGKKDIEREKKFIQFRYIIKIKEFFHGRRD